jgi:hypothetical protein
MQGGKKTDVTQLKGNDVTQLPFAVPITKQMLHRAIIVFVEEKQ